LKVNLKEVLYIGCIFSSRFPTICMSLGTSCSPYIPIQKQKQPFDQLRPYSSQQKAPSFAYKQRWRKMRISKLLTNLTIEYQFLKIKDYTACSLSLSVFFVSLLLLRLHLVLFPFLQRLLFHVPFVTLHAHPGKEVHVSRL
jgi:hypothetical protein